MSGHADVLVVGAGIVGAACALFLARAGAGVEIVDRSFAASGTSRACDGLILFSDKASAAELELARASAALWAELADTLPVDFEYRHDGTLVLYETEAALDDGRLKAERLSAARVRVEVVSHTALRKLEPNLAPDLAGAILYRDEAQVDARLATVAMLAEAQHLGVRFHPGVKVASLLHGQDRGVCGVRTAVGDLRAGSVVCAAGVWSHELLQPLDIELPVRPRKGHILVTARVPALVHHPLLEGSYAASVQSAAEEVQVALVAEMTGSGTMLLGSSREFAGFDRSVSVAVIKAVAARATRFLPALARTSVIRSYAGLRPWSPDHLPLVGPLTDIPGLYLATGHEGAGIGLAPITGQIIAQWLTGGQVPGYAQAIQPDRFSVLRSRDRF